MDISIVIVNYNVKHFLEQCLHSVYRAVHSLEAEVFVVDNNSVDGSCQMVREKFPWVKLIENNENLGFSKANNQALRMATGRYSLLLNPDTFVQEDTFVKCINFCDSHPDAGGLGVKMIDGRGEFLPESKRSLPTPAVAFYKIFGLSALFPRSKVFGKYHLGYLDAHQTHSVQILAGAFMMVRQTVLEKIGLLDESFFMYGEDIDLSYRITQAGYKNYYFPETTIIHYKGESTKKGSINYVMVFYKAMNIFARKHFTAKNARLYALLIHFAIYFRAALGIIRRIVLNLFEPVLDFVFLYFGFYLIASYWEMVKGGYNHYFPRHYFTFIIPLYIFTWIFSLFIAGGYEKKIKPINLIKGIGWGSLAIIFIYALLPESLRFSRFLILGGTIWALIIVFMVRVLGTFVFPKNRKLELAALSRQIAIVGEHNEANRVLTILKESGLYFEYTGRIGLHQRVPDDDVIGSIDQLDEIIAINKVDEIIFCSADIAASHIINAMLTTSSTATAFKIAPPESISVIGSNSIHTTGDLYVIDLNSLNKGMNKRKKRLFDLASASLLLFLSPFLFPFIKSYKGFLRNALKVVTGKVSWVGIRISNSSLMVNHNEIKKGVLNPADGFKSKSMSDSVKERLNINYAKDYRVIHDVKLVARNIRELGRNL
ncbi:MAG: glycosyltransferase [Bacteroidota bacterium]|nr:MAG: glycosyltransferase [Bacteroidota bacterium]